MAKREFARQLAADFKHEHSPAHPLERLIFFSDAVFAIAITLLIIEVHPPRLGFGAGDREHLIALANLTPSFVAFFISFFVIGAFWMGHHRAFSLSRHWSPTLLFPNILMLAAIVFMPFATAYMGTNMGERVPTVLYDVVLFVTGLLNIRLVRLATSAPVVDEHADPLVIARTRARGWGVTLGAALALLLAFVFPRISQFGLLTIPLWLRLSVRRAEKRAHSPRR
jgi:TMEM175 potassium channel family protein